MKRHIAAKQLKCKSRGVTVQMNLAALRHHAATTIILNVKCLPRKRRPCHVFPVAAAHAPTTANSASSTPPLTRPPAGEGRLEALGHPRTAAPHRYAGWTMPRIGDADMNEGWLEPGSMSGESRPPQRSPALNGRRTSSDLSYWRMERAPYLSSVMRWESIRPFDSSCTR